MRARSKKTHSRETRLKICAIATSRTASSCLFVRHCSTFVRTTSRTLKAISRRKRQRSAGASETTLMSGIAVSAIKPWFQLVAALQKTSRKAFKLRERLRIEIESSLCLSSNVAEENPRKSTSRSLFIQRFIDACHRYRENLTVK